MTVLVLLLLALAAASPLLVLPLRRVVTDPVVPVAALGVLLLGVAAAVAARVDPTDGWRLAAAVVLGVVVATTGGSLVVRAVFRLMRREFLPARAARLPAPSAETAPDALPEETSSEPGTVLRGGAWIGCLERAAVAATLLAGWPEGIALVLAVKGVGRYAELRETNAPEAFIIGTLTSLLWAAAAAGTAHLLR
ncbi:MAG TPA: hypothetical protein VFV76_13385 [Actinomycetes bacterium]|nr:hypothetical protein [Actinomycetes bacterium]